MLYCGDSAPWPDNREWVQAYSLEGVPLFNMSFGSLSPPLYDVSSMAIANGELQVLEGFNHRLTAWSTTNGSLLLNIDLGIDYALALVSDRDTLFVARYFVTSYPGGYTFNSSVLRFDRQGVLQEQYVFGPQQAEGVFTRLALSDDRLYGYDEYYGTLAVWRVGRGESGQVGEQTAAGVRRIEPETLIKGKEEQAEPKGKALFESLKSQRRLPHHMIESTDEQ